MSETKIYFRIEPEEDGFPPISVESMHASPHPEGGYILQNTPFFAEDVALGDRVAVEVRDECLWYSETICRGEGVALSVILLDESAKNQLVRGVRGLVDVSEYGEFGSLQMYALGTDLKRLSKLSKVLMELEGANLISFAELAVV